MTLTTIGIDRRTTVTNGLYQCDILVGVPLESIEVVVNQNRVRETFSRHLESLDQPVVACLTAATQRLLHQGVACLVAIDSLVDHIYHGQMVVLLLNLIKPVFNSNETFGDRQVAVKPTVGILCSPYQRMELVSEVMTLGIIERIITPPVVGVACTLHRAPLRFILRGHLIPEFIINRNPASGIHLIAGGNIT